MSMQACPKCGTTVAVSEKSCPNCKQDLQQVQQKTQKKQRSFLAALLGLLGIRRNPQTGSLGCAVVPATISVTTIALVTVVVVAGPVLKAVPPFASGHTVPGTAVAQRTTPNPSSPLPRPGTITEFSMPTANSRPTDITNGPDGNIWFTELGKIGRITPGK
jgi:hypothetical protein